MTLPFRPSVCRAHHDRPQHHCRDLCVLPPPQRPEELRLPHGTAVLVRLHSTLPLSVCFIACHNVRVCLSVLLFCVSVLLFCLSSWSSSFRFSVCHSIDRACVVLFLCPSTPPDMPPPSPFCPFLPVPILLTQPLRCAISSAVTSSARWSCWRLMSSTSWSTSTPARRSAGPQSPGCGASISR